MQNRKEGKMKRYFVKAIFSGWREVDKEHFDAFVKLIREGSINVPYEKKDEFIASKTKIIETA